MSQEGSVPLRDIASGLTFRFSDYQKEIENKKQGKTTRKPDREIEKTIKRLEDEESKIKDAGMGFAVLRPLVEIWYKDGEIVEKDYLLNILRYSSFPHKKRIVREIMKDRADGMFKDGRLTLVHKGKKDNSATAEPLNIDKADNSATAEPATGGFKCQN